MSRLYNILNAIATKLGKVYVTETGTSNSWTYKKYSDGTYEAWRGVQASGMSIQSSSAGTYYGDSAYLSITLPSFSNAIDLILATETSSQTSGVYIYTAEVQSSSKIKLEFRAHSSQSGAACGARVYIRGRFS